MKSIILTVISTILSLTSLCQDMIVTKSGDTIQAKVLEANIDKILYKEPENPNSPTLKILIHDVSVIQYANGTKDVFDEEKNVKPDSSSELSSRTLYIRGHKDAYLFYDGYKGAATSTLVTGLISPIIGLIPAIACSSTKPHGKNLYYPDADQIKQPAYYNGYIKGAKKIKQRKVWTNWGIAFGVNIVAVVILNSAIR